MRSMIFPAYMTATSWGELRHDTEIMRNQQNRHAHLILESFEQIENLSRDRDIQGCGWFVGN